MIGSNMIFCGGMGMLFKIPYFPFLLEATKHTYRCFYNPLNTSYFFLLNSHRYKLRLNPEHSSNQNRQAPKTSTSPRHQVHCDGNHILNPGCLLAIKSILIGLPPKIILNNAAFGLHKCRMHPLLMDHYIFHNNLITRHPNITTPGKRNDKHTSTIAA